MESITTALANAPSLITTVMGVITENAILCSIFACGTFFPLGLRMFRGSKKAALR